MRQRATVARVAACVFAAASCASAQVTEFRYTMRGEVRLLFFWAGRDRVGGGHIRIARGNSPSRYENIEVLFGSDPARVPGRMSRWGFGVEHAAWADGPVEKTVFEGFMRISREQSMSEAVAAAKTGDPPRFHSIRSVVEAKGASSQIRFFDLPDALDYRAAEQTVRKLRAEIAARPADVSRSLPNLPQRYSEPHGFLTALFSMTRKLGETLAKEGRAQGPVLRTVYVFNARPYRLIARNVKKHGETGQAEFETVNLDKGTKTAFTLRFPLHGEHRGVPTEILMQPRWWLRLRLRLVEVKP